MAAYVFKRRLRKMDRYKSEELIHQTAGTPEPEEVMKKRQVSFESYAGILACSAGGVSPGRSRAASLPCSRVKLLLEADVQVCRVVHGRTLINKLLNTKYLRRWETHHLLVTDEALCPRTCQGFMDAPIPYSDMLEIRPMGRWEAAHKFCLRLVLPNGVIVLQTSSPTTRDQWYHSILWKKRMCRYRNVLRQCSRPEVLVREIKAMIDMCAHVSLRDDSVFHTPMNVISGLLTQDHLWTGDRLLREELILAMSPLLERLHPSRQVCEFLSDFCRDCPRSLLVHKQVAPVVERILKHNVDFSKYLHSRRLVQDFLLALGSQPNGDQAIRDLVLSMHGPGSTCPHPRVLPNLVAACLGAIFLLHETRRRTRDIVNEADTAAAAQADETEKHVQKLLYVISVVSEYDDWRPGLALLIQPIPFPENSLNELAFLMALVPVLQRLAEDPRCEVHKMVLATREGKDGWLDVVCPSAATCPDDGTLWTDMLKTLLSCCCRRKVFLRSLLKVLGACQLMALRGNSTCQDILCQMLEWSLVSHQDQRVTVSTLITTPEGEERYRTLCERMNQLRELQSKGGPRVLSLPSRSTDEDLAKLLSTGCLGNLEVLSLAFTSVTSQCAEHLIKLPSLRCLNLWCTQFGDAGLLLVTEHLHKLQVLNLCETFVTNKSLITLTALKELHTLNLNSTKLSVETLTELRRQLPLLKDVDVRYTDAW